MDLFICSLCFLVRLYLSIIQPSNRTKLILLGAHNFTEQSLILKGAARTIQLIELSWGAGRRYCLGAGGMGESSAYSSRASMMETFQPTKFLDLNQFIFGCSAGGTMDKIISLNPFALYMKEMQSACDHILYCTFYTLSKRDCRPIHLTLQR